jgi:hypothetical protein
MDKSHERYTIFFSKLNVGNFIDNREGSTEVSDHRCCRRWEIRVGVSVVVWAVEAEVSGSSVVTTDRIGTVGGW